jgi:uncharacterized protein (DUF2344 family)
MVKDYQNGKIYRIVCNITGEQYVGSTCETLSRRLSVHIRHYKCWKKSGKCRNITSFRIIERGDYDIVLIENHPCNNKEELHRRERCFMDNIECVNKNREKQQKHYYSNIEKIQEKQKYRSKKYAENNKEQIAEYKKKWYDENKERLCDMSKKRYEENKEELSAKYREKYTCECGSIFCKGDKARHFKTKKHIKFIDSLAENINL